MFKKNRYKEQFVKNTSYTDDYDTVTVSKFTKYFKISIRHYLSSLDISTLTKFLKFHTFLVTYIFIFYISNENLQ